MSASVDMNIGNGESYHSIPLFSNDNYNIGMLSLSDLFEIYNPLKNMLMLIFFFLQIWTLLLQAAATQKY